MKHQILAEYFDLFGKAAPKVKKAPPSTADPHAKLRLKDAAAIAFPDRSVSVSALRREAAAGRLRIYRIAGKDITTLADIEEMIQLCRVQAKDPASSSRKPKTEDGSGLSGTDSERSALDALRATAKVLKENLQPTSRQSTTRKPAAAAVIPIRSK